jgi:hypothetical protein
LDEWICTTIVQFNGVYFVTFVCLLILVPILIFSHILPLSFPVQSQIREKHLEMEVDRLKTERAEIAQKQTVSAGGGETAVYCFLMCGMFFGVL